MSLVFLDGPHPASGAGDPELPAEFNGTLREWWRCPSTASGPGQEIPYLSGWQEKDCDGLDRSCKALHTIFQDLGPFDGIIGFSQGAAMAHLISHELSEDLRPSWALFLSAVRCPATEVHHRFTTAPTRLRSLHVW